MLVACRVHPKLVIARCFKFLRVVHGTVKFNGQYDSDLFNKCGYWGHRADSSVTKSCFLCSTGVAKPEETVYPTTLSLFTLYEKHWLLFIYFLYIFLSSIINNFINMSKVVVIPVRVGVYQICVL